MKLRVTVTESTPFEQLPIWLTVKEAAIYTGRSYKALVNALGEHRSPLTGEKRGKKWMIHKNQLCKTEIKREFK